jgi:hypothetical protein
MRSFKRLSILGVCAVAFLQVGIAGAHNLKGDPRAIDVLVQHSTAEAWKDGHFGSTELSGEGTPAPARAGGRTGGSVAITLGKDYNGKTFTSGYYESQPISVGLRFHEVLPSWNIELPPGTGYAIQLSVKKEKGKSPWSIWYFIVADNAREEPILKKLKKDPLGTVDVDYWTGSPVSLVKYRVWLFSHDGQSTPKVRRFFLALRGSRKNNRRYSPPETGASSSIPERFNTPAPFKWQSQLAQRKLWGQICCPTAAAMLLGALGHDVETTTVVNMCYDPDEDSYGVWPRASQTISQFGLVSYVRRFRDLDEVRRQLAQGTPVMASIKAKKGELPEAIYSSTGGHLILLTGYEGKDWFIVNDPASRNRAKCFQVKYSAGGIQKAWLDNGGVGIVAFPEKE